MVNRARFDRFVEAMSLLVAGADGNEDAILGEGRGLLAGLVAHDDWLDDSCCLPERERYRQHVLHADPAGSFCILSLVWDRGQSTPVHDHAVWGIVGVLRGEEIVTPYRLAGGKPQAGAPVRQRRGDVEVLSGRSADIHQVSNAADGVSISIHVYGGTVGAVRRYKFDPLSGAPQMFLPD